MGGSEANMTVVLQEEKIGTEGRPREEDKVEDGHVQARGTGLE